MTEQPATPEPPVTPMPRLGRGVTWSAHPGIDGIVPPTEPYQPKPRTRPAAGWPKTGDVGATAQLRADELPVTVPARPYGEPRFATGGVVFPQTDGDVIPLPISRCLYEQPRAVPPLAAELRAIADDLNAHGGFDETFVAELLRQAADPLADAKRGLGIVDPPPPVTTTTKPITYEQIVAALEKIAPLGQLPLATVKLTQAQIDTLPHTRHAAPSERPWHFFGTPVELVETVEESTPYQLTAKPGGIIEIDTNLTDAEFARLRNDWLHAVERGPVPFGLFSGGMPPRAYFREAVEPAAPRPWWRRALGRVRRWTR